MSFVLLLEEEEKRRVKREESAGVCESGVRRKEKVK